MKRYLLLFVGIIISLSSFAQAQHLGKSLDDNFLNSYFDEFEMKRGDFNSSRNIYPNSLFEGYSNGIKTTVETNSNGKISTINCFYTNFTSKEQIVSFADEIMKHSFAKVTSKEITDKRLLIKAQISNSPYNYKSMAITSNWDYNSYGDFFLGEFWIWYSWLSF